MATTEKAVAWNSKLYGSLWGPAIVWMLRLVVGAVFVFSGFTKGIDPWGSIYKFDEYLRAFGFYDYRGLLTFMAFSVSAVEFVLGVFLLFGIYRRFTPWAMTAMMAVMLPLTCYIAVTDNVADCGCFGDAVTLSNWGTFWKNVALTVGLVYLIMFNSRVKNIYGFAVQWIVAMLTFVYILLVAWLGYSFQPLVDFRPFPVGTVISGEDVEAADEYAFIYEKNGVKQEFSLDSLPDDTWTFVDRKPLSTLESSADVAGMALHRPIAVFDTAYVAADDVILDRGEQLLLLFPSLNDVVIPFTYRINEICDFCRRHDIDVVGLTSDGKAEIDEWNDFYMTPLGLWSINSENSLLSNYARPVFLEDNLCPSYIGTAAQTIAYIKNHDPNFRLPNEQKIRRMAASAFTFSPFSRISNASYKLSFFVFGNVPASRSKAPETPTGNETESVEPEEGKQDIRASLKKFNITTF